MLGLFGGELNRRASRNRGTRSGSDMRRRRAAGVGHYHLYTIDGHPQRFGGDLRQDGRRALSDIDPPNGDLNPAVRRDSYLGLALTSSPALVDAHGHAQSAPQRGRARAIGLSTLAPADTLRPS